jgi:predicted ATPase/DNA-binding CsgD family transcriptional regulator
VHGFPAALTSFVGRAQAVAEVADQLERNRLVTVTGPGGAGKTRLAAEVAREVAGRFADGVWLAGLAAVREPAQVVAAVVAALGIRELPGIGAGGLPPAADAAGGSGPRAAAEALAHALARRQLLLVLDNCEHVIEAAAELCGRLLLGADDVRVLATSREPLRIAGEARFRLGPLTLPDPGDPAATAGSEAVELFADRAGRVDPGFRLDDQTGALVGRLVARLDGMPLAIELAAARTDSLGVAQLLDRIEDRFGLLADGDRLAEQRQRSLAATVQWSYQLLDERERRVFRAVSAFPGPFTLDGAEAVAGPTAGRALLRLVDCSLLVPPRVDPDGRSRYVMLETLRAYGAGLLIRASEDGEVAAALAAYAVQLAEEAAGGLETRTAEAASLRQLDAEDVTLRHALAWAMGHDQVTALRLAFAQAPWWQLRGRLTSQAPLLATAAGQLQAGSDAWCVARMWLGQAASQSADPATALDHFTAVRDALATSGHPGLLASCLSGRASSLLYLSRAAEAAADGGRSLELFRRAGSPGGEAMALACLSVAAWYAGDRDQAIELAHQAQRRPDEIPGSMARALSEIVTMVLTEAGDLAAADQACTTGLSWCREVGDLGNLVAQLWNRAVLDLREGRVADAAAHLHEQLQIAAQAGLRPSLLVGLDCCGCLCAATRRPAEAITVWAATSALAGPWPPPHGPWYREHRDELAAKAREGLEPAKVRTAAERGAAMSLATATEYALMLAAAVPVAEDSGLDVLSPRERELVTLVAQGHTDAQIATRLNISGRTVSSHLDRIRDKTGCRRRADLTRLALSTGLV